MSQKWYNLFPIFGTCAAKSAHNDGKIDIRLSVLQVFTNIGRKINSNKLIHFNPHRMFILFNGTINIIKELNSSECKSLTMTWMVGIMMNAMKVSWPSGAVCAHTCTLALHAEYIDCSMVLSRLHTWSLKCDTRLCVGHYLNIVYTGNVNHHFSIFLQYSFIYWSFFLFSCFTKYKLDKVSV